VQPAVLPDEQAIPGPLTDPVPVPAVVTVSGYVAGWNAAMTVRAPLTSTEQVLPLHDVQPDQLFTIVPASGTAVSVMVDPFGSSALQVPAPPGAQSIPGPVTRPPVPAAHVGLTVTR
jgi:hypothetical protein